MTLYNSSPMSNQKEFKNRKAFFEYEVLEKVEAGIALMGSEVKAIRDGKLNLSDSYARMDAGELYLVNCHISEYKSAATFGHEALRKRKLLLHRAEIKKIEMRIQEKGLTVLPIRVFFNERGLVKIELGIGRGKKHHDKRQATKTKEIDREIRREMSRR